jgi:hypothetical protein
MGTEIVDEKTITMYTYALTCDAIHCKEKAQVTVSQAYGREDAGIDPPKGWVPDGEHAIENAYAHPPLTQLYVGEACFCARHAFFCGVCKQEHGGEICECVICDNTGLVQFEVEEDECPSCKGESRLKGVADCKTCNNTGLVNCNVGDVCPRTHRAGHPPAVASNTVAQ